MKYDKEFEEVYKTAKPQEEGVFSMHDVAFTIWQAARKDHYRIGEEVESITNHRPAQIRAVVDWDGGCLYELNSDDVRRIPAKSRIDEIAEDGLKPIYETFEKLAYALQKTVDVLDIAVKDGIGRALEEKEHGR